MQPAKINEWMDAKFGMFIHYGLYSIPGEGEWMMFEKPMDKDEYALLADKFSAERFDSDYITELARSAGMNYAVLTTRHHDGFCLFDSKCSAGDFTIAHSAAKGRDLVKEFADSCHAMGLGVGFYYSPIDWRLEGFFFPQMYHASALRLRAQTHGQIRELMENYGKVDTLWYDGGEDYWLAHGKHLNNGSNDNFRENPLIPGFWGEYELNALARTMQPGIIINNRIGAKKTGDFTTHERVVGPFNPSHPWETNDTISESWGWMPDTKLRSLKNIIHLLTDVITGGGNLLLNISPKGDGSIEPSHAQRLRETGAWIKKYGEAVYGTRGGPIKNNAETGGAVWKDNNIYLHIKDEKCKAVKIPLSGLSAFSGEAVCLTGEMGPETHFRDGILTVSLPENRNEIETIVKVALPDRADKLFESFEPDDSEPYVF